ncbi:MAG: CpsD/CapB family tyrosine-protein kinase [Candidatus Omnitrophica bacterium]|nr:CpsD/CapB family tyrosine-protein kinase [Candidatus Omnitrophota bacterium]
MGKITNALKKAAEERLTRIEKISQIKERDRLILKKIGASNMDPSVITYFDPKALISEQYKILRTNILSMNKGKPPKTFIITSSIHAEGKTITALNLAVSLAQAVHKPRVLLVDGDLRKGRVGYYLSVERKIGLSEVLRGEADVKDAVFHIELENLAFIAAGHSPEYPSELLSSENFRKFLNHMQAEFDHIIIDTPPIIAVTDAGILGSQVEGVLLVVQAGRTQRGIVKRAEELLFQSHAKIMGHVLTNIEYHLPEYIYRYL